MAKPDNEKSDGLEIISIGTLYSGPWDKKYWSSSRGKDRYPYPVGYKAVRTHNGITYKMEIEEGLKGPSFSITSTDGQPCSGQTPDITWESFQKKGGPRVKLWHGKKLSCKIDGVEFFGFKNAFVQRLLRELVANISGTAEQSCLISSLGNRDSGMSPHTQSGKSSTILDQLPDVARPVVKVNRRHKNLNSDSTDAASLKRFRPKDKVHNNEASDTRESTQNDLNGGICMAYSASNEVYGMCSDPVALASPMNLETVVEGKNNSFSVEDALPLESSYYSNHLNEEVPSPQKSKLVISENCMPAGIVGSSPLDDKSLDRSSDAEIQGFSSSMAAEYKDGEVPVLTDSQIIDNMDLCAPDTLDLMHDSISDSQPNRQKESHCNGNCDLIAGDMVIAEGMATESQLEEKMGTSNSSSEKSGFELVGQEIAKSMMTVLLPRALPLLKTFSRKKKMIMNPPKSFCSGQKSQEENNGTNHHPGIASPGTIDDNLTGVVISSQTLHKEIDFKTRGGGTGSTSITAIPNAATLTKQQNGPLTESIIFRSPADGCAPETYAPTNFLLASEIQPASSFYHDRDKRVPSGAEGWSHSLHGENTNNPNDVLHNTATVMSQNQPFVCTSNDKELDFLDPSLCTEKYQACTEELQRHQNFSDVSNSVSWLQKQGTNFCVYNRVVADSSSINSQRKMGHNDEPESAVHFVGCYVHPLPILLVLLNTKESEIRICVICSVLVDKDKALFMYKLSLKEQMLGCPSFIGHTPIMLSFSRDAIGREIALDRSSLQFTPDGNCLVFLNSIKAPCCREGKLQCPCSVCRSDCLQKNAVKIVQVKHGYVSVVMELKTVDNVRCILVCEPNHLIGVEDSGRLHLWVMNSTWSAQIEECDLSTSDCIFPCIVELKRIPNCGALILGHNGFGEFGLWDICKRIFVARFSSPSCSVFQSLPISLITWQTEDLVFRETHGKEHITEIMAATKNSFLAQAENHAFIPKQGEDVAIWLLVSSTCSSDIHPDLQSSDRKINPVGLWRLALLVKDRMILGSALDPRAAAIGASAGHGIIGTCDGLVYMWELSTGAKLCDLHCFQDAGVSCIATDDSRLGPLAIACGGQLLIYLHSQAGPLRTTCSTL